MKFTFLTLFPSLVSGYFSDSILKRAKEEKKIEIEWINPRDFSKNRFKKVDDYQVGGGAGLVVEAQTIIEAITSIQMGNPRARVIFLLPAAKPFTCNDAQRLATHSSHLVLVCGRYEGIDERALEVCADEIFSMGDYILTGGELAALALCDAVARQIPGVLRNENSLQGESFEASLLESPVFARTKMDIGSSPPSEYSKGDHAKISALKRELSLAKTKYYRPDLYEKYRVQIQDRGKNEK